MKKLCFSHSCPVCGRTALIRIENLGSKLACGHCHGTFVATGQPNRDEASDQVVPSLEDRPLATGSGTRQEFRSCPPGTDEVYATSAWSEVSNER